MFEFLLRRHLPDRVLIQHRAGVLAGKSSGLLEAHVMLCPTCQLQLEDLLPPTADHAFLRRCAARELGHAA